MFSVGKEERAAAEGIENPAFNISSTDLSAYQPSEEKVIRHDKPDSTLAAHQQKLGLQAHAEPRGETSNLISLKRSDSACAPHPTRAPRPAPGVPGPTCPDRHPQDCWRHRLPTRSGSRAPAHSRYRGAGRVGLCQRGKAGSSWQSFPVRPACRLGFRRHRSRSEHTDAAPSLAPPHWAVLTSLQPCDWLLSLGLPYALSQSASCFCSVFHYFFQTVLLRCSESCLSRGAIPAFKLGFDAAPRGVAASGSNFCLLFKVYLNYKDHHCCQFSFRRGLISFNLLITPFWIIIAAECYWGMVILTWQSGEEKNLKASWAIWGKI